jgi:chromosome segregation ATPase
MPEEIAAPITSWSGLISLIGALGLGGVLTAFVSRPSRRAVAATAAKDEATGEAAVIGALANAFTDTTASLREEIERMQNTLNEFRQRVAEAEGEVRAVLAREAIKDRLIADQKAQLEIAHQDVIRLRGERDAAMDKAVQQEGEIRQLKAVIHAHERARD